ncbi:hypothetical protein OsI_16862 [Oryza sativa Indica Group]|uniref:Uncharacterized protein n=1 Tax=Oryza sativa subsp. indica TaxID=39946 RepID=B8ASN5_ORYSI|nr:hypothetical protein OsI_16862 [Oryza sativa Indica Group]
MMHSHVATAGPTVTRWDPPRSSVGTPASPAAPGERAPPPPGLAGVAPAPPGELELDSMQNCKQSKTAGKSRALTESVADEERLAVEPGREVGADVPAGAVADVVRRRLGYPRRAAVHEQDAHRESQAGLSHWRGPSHGSSNQRGKEQVWSSEKVQGLGAQTLSMQDKSISNRDLKYNS